MHNEKDTTTSQIIPSQHQRYLGNSRKIQLIATMAELDQESR